MVWGAGAGGGGATPAWNCRPPGQLPGILLPLLLSTSPPPTSPPRGRSRVADRPGLTIRRLLTADLLPQLIDGPHVPDFGAGKLIRLLGLLQGGEDWAGRGVPEPWPGVPGIVVQRGKADGGSPAPPPSCLFPPREHARTRGGEGRRPRPVAPPRQRPRGVAFAASVASAPLARGGKEWGCGAAPPPVSLAFPWPSPGLVGSRRPLGRPRAVDELRTPVRALGGVVGIVLAGVRGGVEVPSVDVSEADWQKCASCRSGADRRAQRTSLAYPCRWDRRSSRRENASHLAGRRSSRLLDSDPQCLVTRKCCQMLPLADSRGVWRGTTGRRSDAVSSRNA
jgi:hypothetical protein